MTQKELNNRANQLNPNNPAYWLSRMGQFKQKKAKTPAPMPKQKAAPQKQRLIKCDFCEIYNPRTKTCTPSNFYCSRANDEYLKFLKRK